jgi:hypothetical protein
LALVEIRRGNIMTKFVALCLTTFPLLAGVPTAAAIAGTIGYALPIHQMDDGAIVKVGEWCGADSFRDEYGHCRHYSFSSYGALPAAAHEECPPDRHFVHWVNHSGGRCVPNY